MENNLRPDWDKYFMLITKMVAIRSTCLSRQLGAVIVGNKDANRKQIISTGYNGALPGIKSCSEMGYCYYRKHGLPKSACLSNHAEANSIDMAARAGISTHGSIIYLLLTPCYLCAKKIVMAGIKHVVYLDTHMVLNDTDKRIKDLFDTSNITFSKISVNFNDAMEFLTTNSQQRQLAEHEDLIKQGREQGHE